MVSFNTGSIARLAEGAQAAYQENKKTVLAVAGAGTLVAGAALLYRRHKNAVPKNGPYPVGSLPADSYDAVIVGAGPSGATCGYYMARGGAKVVMLDKEHFPRDKYCGDAVCTPAIRILDEMGVMKELIDNNEAHFADAGGFVSPSGISYIGASKEKLGEAACCAVKRINLDNRIVKNSQKNGAAPPRCARGCAAAPVQGRRTPVGPLLQAPAPYRPPAAPAALLDASWRVAIASCGFDRFDQRPPAGRPEPGPASCAACLRCLHQRPVLRSCAAAACRASDRTRACTGPASHRPHEPWRLTPPALALCRR
jgi:hypothetical protein